MDKHLAVRNPSNTLHNAAGCPSSGGGFKSKLCMLLNNLGLVSAWDCDNVHDTSFQHLIQRFSDQMVVLADMGFHAREGNPSNLKLCERGEWNERMMVETSPSAEGCSHWCVTSRE